MRGLGLFLILIPLLASLGHDIYLFVNNGGSIDTLQQAAQTTIEGTEGEPGVKTFFASLGYIWTQYHPESYKWTAENVDQTTWSYINLLLKQKAVVVSAILAAVAYLLALIFKKLNGEQSTMGSSRVDKVLNKNKGGKGKKMKYKRK